MPRLNFRPRLFTRLLMVAGVSSLFAAGTISTPPNWPTGQLAAGYPYAVAADALPLDQALDLTTYALRSISIQIADGGGASSGQAITALNELYNSLPNLVGWDGQEGRRDVRIGASMSIFSREITEASVEPTEEKYQILRKMNDVGQISRWFSLIQEMQGAMNGAGQSAIVLEPNVWGTILQARFHFENEDCGEAWCAGKKWADVLDFSVPLYAGLNASGSPVAAEVQGNPALFPETVRGLARAMVLAAKRTFTSATVFGHASSWAVYANGCNVNGTTEALTSQSLLEFKSSKSMVHWSDEDIQISAMANVRFYRELFGWDWNEEGKPNDYNGGLMWPHGFAVEKWGFDAGMVEKNDAHYNAQTADPLGMPGAGTKTFFWNQLQMDKWLTWANVLSQGSGLPLLAFGIPLGNGSLSNEAMSWKDTFVDWLFNSSNWGGAYTWTPGNWDKFKNAGFVGIWAGRGGWPATGTHWGYRAIAGGDGSGCNYPINGQSAFCGGSTPGDGGFFFRSWKAANRTFEPVPVTFDEEHFAEFSGFCTGRSEATVKTELVGVQAEDAEGNLKPGVFMGSTKNPVVTVDGDPTTQALDNGTQISLMPEYMKSNALWLFAMDDTKKFQPIQGTGGTRVNGGIVTSDAQKGEIKDVLENRLSTIGVVLKVDFSTIEGWPYWSDKPDWRIASVFPIEYEIYIYDHLGHYINSVQGYLSDEDVAALSKVDPEDGHLKLTLLLYFVPMDTKGRHIASGVYTMRGFFKEQTKRMCQTMKNDLSADQGCGVDGQQDPRPGHCPMDPNGIITVVKDLCPGKIWERHGVDVNNIESIQNGTWETNVFQNSVVITEKFGYTRMKK